MSTPSGFLKLDLADLTKGCITAVIAAVVSVLNTAASSASFDIFTYDWWGIGKFAISVASVYLIKNVLTDSDGKVLGINTQ